MNSWNFKCKHSIFKEFVKYTSVKITLYTVFAVILYLLIIWYWKFQLSWHSSSILILLKFWSEVLMIIHAQISALSNGLFKWNTNSEQSWTKDVVKVKWAIKASCFDKGWIIILYQLQCCTNGSTQQWLALMTSHTCSILSTHIFFKNSILACVLQWLVFKFLICTLLLSNNSLI